MKRYEINNSNLTPKEKMVWDILKERYGKVNSITSGEIYKMTGIDRFQLAGIVQTLRLQYNVPVCANKWGENKGYFLPTNQQEIHATMDELEAQASKLIDVVSVLYNAGKELSRIEATS